MTDPDIFATQKEQNKEMARRRIEKGEIKAEEEKTAEQLLAAEQKAEERRKEAEQKAEERRKVSEEKARQRRENEMTNAHEAVEDARIALAYTRKVMNRAYSGIIGGIGLVVGIPVIDAIIGMTWLMVAPVFLGIVMIVLGGGFVFSSIADHDIQNDKKKLRDAERRLSKAVNNSLFNID